MCRSPAFCEPGACSSSCDIWRPLTGSPVDLALTDVDADARRADVEDRRRADRRSPSSCTPAGLSSKSSVELLADATGIAVYSIGAKPVFRP